MSSKTHPEAPKDAVAYRGKHRAPDPIEFGATPPAANSEPSTQEVSVDVAAVLSTSVIGGSHRASTAPGGRRADRALDEVTITYSGAGKRARRRPDAVAQPLPLVRPEVRAEIEVDVQVDLPVDIDVDAALDWLVATGSLAPTQAETPMYEAPAVSPHASTLDESPAAIEQRVRETIFSTLIEDLDSPESISARSHDTGEMLVVDFEPLDGPADPLGFPAAPTSAWGARPEPRVSLAPHDTSLAHDLPPLGQAPADHIGGPAGAVAGTRFVTRPHSRIRPRRSARRRVFGSLAAAAVMGGITTGVAYAGHGNLGEGARTVQAMVAQTLGGHLAAGPVSRPLQGRINAAPGAPSASASAPSDDLSRAAYESTYPSAQQSLPPTASGATSGSSATTDPSDGASSGLSGAGGSGAAGGSPSAPQTHAGIVDATGGRSAAVQQAANSLSIPAIGVRAQMRVVNFSDGVLNPPSNVSQVGLWGGGAEPSAEFGTTVVVGHVSDDADRPGAFAHLSSLKRGDIIKVTTRYVRPSGKRVSMTRLFRVKSTTTYPKGSLPSSALVAPAAYASSAATGSGAGSVPAALVNGLAGTAWPWTIAGAARVGSVEPAASTTGSPDHTLVLITCAAKETFVGGGFHYQDNLVVTAVEQ